MNNRYFVNFIASGELHKEDAISNYDIEKIVKQIYPSLLKYFKGVFLWDELKKASEVNRSNDIWCIILCTTTTKDPPSKIGHWVSLIVDNNKRQIMYYDSFGDKPKPISKFYKSLLAAKKYKDQSYQIKINRVKNQRVDSVRCGYFAILFLVSVLLEKKTFKDATDFNSITGEKKAKLLQNRFKTI